MFVKGCEAVKYTDMFGTDDHFARQLGSAELGRSGRTKRSLRLVIPLARWSSMTVSSGVSLSSESSPAWLFNDWNRHSLV